MFIKKMSKFSLFVLGLTSAFLTSLPVKAAEKLLFTYGPIELSVKVESLELFAKDGTINEDLGQYLNRISPKDQAIFRESLTKKIDIDGVKVSRFFNTEMGESILLRLGKGITLEGGKNGGIALRGAIIQSALDPSGLTLLNVLKKYPTDLQIQGELVVGAAEYGKKVIKATETLVKEMRTWTVEEATTDPATDYNKLADIRKAGPYQIKKEKWQLTDKSRNRSFYVNVFVPQNVTNNIPVIVFSHGLGASPDDYDDTLNHLASNGFLVAAPQHIGSDTTYFKEMFEGLNKNIFDRDEFINRPKDLSFVIDELERRNQGEFQGKLNLKNVGISGHSFGGYTVLAVAGATIDFDYLQQSCDRLYGGLNAAILLECRALELPREDYNFKDPRVSAVFAGNLVNRFIFGEKGISKITIPVMLGSGSDDPATPPAFEQAVPFTWLNTPNKYWALIEGQAHVNFNEIDGGIKEALDSTLNLTFPPEDLISAYIKGISLAFFEIHLNNNQNYRPYLQSSYAEYLSANNEFKLSFISANSSDKLKAEIEKFRSENNIK
ncbi:MAG: alpha/beta hydrolase [Cyanobacteria bacterium]|nr:alpha/beta hydrolase [Cyanobacteria bacterium CG_2015-16_32_12]NCO76726.1 alpha/beta hydrolase [Cyanobacteria bacterium CG_2015-22_32_23]NCQ04721.1 alpha/beta hydrolase [Cyanobacteria bacterium CG_2015-09_32_10]NCQ40742.1 alpha/beta hydrolase [Cyanobacteria bacterium CG_2015-04_32_10]NCS85253.1 alpha/beta hydrolase [Cyanobacteria bacterium CG_2015-02_32_10]